MNRKPSFANVFFSVLIGLTLIFSAARPINVSASPAPVKGDGIRRGVHPQTGMLTFLGADASNPIRVESAMRQGLAPEVRGNSVLDVYGPEFGIRDAARELSMVKSSSADGRLTLRYQQVYNKIPVMGGELIVNMQADGSLLSINGEASPNLKIDIQPKVTADAASQQALRSIVKAYNLKASDLTVSKPELWIFDERLIQDNATQPVHLVWRMEVTSEKAPVRELVLVNAKSGGISLHFNQIDTAWRGEQADVKEEVVEPVVSSVAKPIHAPVGIVNQPEGAADPSLNLFVATAGTDDNDNMCTDPASPCATINHAIGKASDGQTIGVAEGTYTGTGTEVVALHKQVNLSGGWDSTFAAQAGLSIIDGQHARYGIFVNIYQSETAMATIDHFAFVNSTGGFYKYDGEATLKNSAVYYNDTVGIYNPRDEIYLENVTVSNNGGNGISDSGTSTITNTTISGNKSSGLSHTGGGTATLRNAIIADNTTDCIGTITSASYNIVKNTTGCTITATTGDQFNVDAGLGKFLPSHGYIPLLSSSPAIDAGDACPVTDQRGQGRPVDGNGDGTSTCDIGAFEYMTPGAAASIWIETGNGQRTRVETAYAMPLTVAILDAQGNPVEGVSATFTAPGSDPSLTFAGGQTTEILTTDGSGTVSTSIPTANAEFGTFNVTVDALALTQASFTLENLNWKWYVSATTGNAINDCKTPSTPCATINAAIGKANETDTIYATEGTYTADLEQKNYVVVVASKSLVIYGGMSLDFTTQTGYSVVDGEKKVGGINVYGYQKTVFIDHFMVMNGAINGGVSLSSVNLTISNSAIFNNVKSGMYADGAGVYNYLGSITLNNVTISNNSTNADIGGQGGGIYSHMGSATLNNVTITNNSSKDGGGVSLGTANQPGASISVKNTILYNNHATNIGPDCYGQSNVNTNNIIGDTTGCTMFSAGSGNQLNVNPFLGTFIEGVGYQPLLAGSPAIDAGLNCYGTADQRGYARVGACDIGAYEYPSSVGSASKLVLAGGDHQRAAPLTLFENPLAVAVLDAQGSPVSGQSVTFRTPSTGASGTFPGGVTIVTVDTGSDGIASSAFTTNDQLGSYLVTAESYGLTTFSFNLQNITWFVKPDGNDLNDCASPLTPCATINGALSKMTDGETIFVASGVYMGTEQSVVSVNKQATILGGWDATFTSQNGYSIIDGENVRLGVYAFGPGASMERFIIQNGYAPAFGGGLNTGGEFTLSNSIIRNNSAPEFGGGILNMGTLTLDNVQIYGNVSETGGGISNANGVSLVINNSAIFSNSADYGGGIHSGSGKVTVNNSTISENVAHQHGGGIKNQYGAFVLNNVTISDNYSNYGGGIYNSNSIENSFLIKNTILANNTAGSTGPNCFGSVKSSGNSLISNTSDCNYISGVGDLVNVNPVLGTFLPSRGYQPILAGSPAINAGSACYGSADQRGVARVGTCDVGAYEYDPIGAAAFMELVGGDNQRTAPTFVFGTPFRVVILDDNGSPVGGQGVTFTAPASGPSGTFANNTNVDSTQFTALDGIATASVFTTNIQAGNYSVVANSSIGSVNFNVANLALYVDSGGSDSNDCQSPATACASIDGAIAKAFDNDVIFVSADTYAGSGDQVINLTKSLTFLGGWDAAFTSQSGYTTIDGGGIRSGVVAPVGVTANLQRFIITNSWNTAIQKGGVHNSGTLTLSQCEISNNIQSYYGGGIYNAGTLFLDECVVKKNSSLIYGGGIYNSGQLTIHDSILHSNIAQSYGGAIYNSGNATITNSLILNNEGFLGAGIYSTGILVLSKTSVSENTSANGGGLWVAGSATIENTTIFGNTASGPGGGIYASGATLDLNNVTVSENLASSGGGVYRSGSSGSVTIQNSILGNNRITTGTGLDCSGAIVSNGYDIISSNAGCTVSAATGDQFNVNPLLGVYLPTQGYQPLMTGSPAINSGNPATCLPTDQRGAPRVGTCDKGAYEYTVPGPAAQIAVADGNNQHVALNDASAPLSIVALDNIGTPVSGVHITFTAPLSDASGVFEGANSNIATAITDVSGIATAPTFYANGQLGGYKITASASVGTAEFDLINLVWFVAPSGGNTNDCLAPSTPCADIPGILQKPGFYSGDTMWLAGGVYDVSGTNVVYIEKSASIIGGWDSGFNARNSTTILRDAMWPNSISRTLNVLIKGVVIENTGTSAIVNSEILRVEDVTLRGNGTGVYNGGQVTIVNTTISGNDASIGGGYGGIYNPEIGLPVNTVTVINSTIAENKGIGIKNYEGAGTFTLINSIVIDNGIGVQSSDCGGKFISGGHNIIGNTGVQNFSDSCSASWLSTDVVGLISNPISVGSVLDATLTQDPATGQWYHPLKLGSLAIDRGNPGLPGSLNSHSCPATDQLGIARPQGVYCDIGAVEYQFNYHPPENLLATYDAGNSTTLPGTQVCSGNDATCAGGDAHETAAQANTFSAYQWYQTWHGRDSMDGNGLQINSTVHYGSGYKNAFWNGHMLVYGDGYGFPLADDVVAHELTHGVTQYESNLFYWYQSGAINESFSDLWGEAVDQANGLGNDSSAVKWLIGEDVTGLGAIRNMQNPLLKNQPDMMTSLKYCKSGTCLTTDNGGVHINSGVNNKAVYLMVDGGTFNTKVVSPLGWNKVLVIYYEAQTNLLTSGSDYLDLYNVLYQACQNKIGTNGITLADCQEVRDATDAVKMNAQPAPNFNPDADYCPSGTSKYQDLYAEDFETGTDGWTLTALSGVSSWGLSTGNVSSGVTSLWADDGYVKADSVATMSAGIALPPGSKAYLHFAHAYNFDAVGIIYYDGGVLEYSTDGGTTWLDAKPLYSSGQNYKGTLKATFGNPLGGRSAFAGDSHGYVDSRYKLESLAGQTVRFRWRMGTDQSYNITGWYVDDVRIYTCVGIPSVPALSAPALNALVTDYTPVFDWSDSTPASDLHHYDLQLATDAAFTIGLVNFTNIPASTYTPLTDLTPNTKYYWRVRSVNAAGGTSAWTASRYFRSALLPPVAQTPGVDVPALAPNLHTRRPTLTWDAVPGATTYTVEVSTAITFATKSVNATTSATSYTPTLDLAANTTFYWRVKTNGTNGPSLYSSPLKTFSTGNPPSVPTLAAPAANALLTSATPLLNWNNSTVPAGAPAFHEYEVQVASDSLFNSVVETVHVSGIANSETVTPALLNGATYYWRVRSVNVGADAIGGNADDDFSGWSLSRSFRIAYAAPVLNLPLDGAINVVLKPTFTWTAIPGATSYNLQVSTLPTFLSLAVNKTINAPVTSYTHTLNLKANTVYYWRVRANGAYGPGFWQSPVFSFTTVP